MGNRRASGGRNKAASTSSIERGRATARSGPPASEGRLDPAPPASSGASSPATSPPGDLSKSASLNAVAAGLDFTARTVVELLLNPLMLRGLGDALFGAWRVLWRLTGYLWATSGRAAQALQSSLANRLHDDDADEKRRLVGASIVVWAMFLPLLSVVTLSAVWLLPGLLDIAPGDVVEVRWAILLLGVDAIAMSLLTIPQAALQGSNRGYKRMGASTVLVLLVGAATAGAVVLDFGLIGIAAVNLLGTVATGLLFWRITRLHVPWFGSARPHRDEVRRFAGLSWWFMAWKFVNQLMLSGDVLILGVLGSVQLVTAYSLSKFIPEATLPLLSMLVMAGIPGLGGIIGSGDHPRARRVRGEVLALTWLLSLSATVAVLVWNESFVSMWVGPEYYAGGTELLLMMLTLMQLALIRSDALIIDVTLRVRTKTLVGLGSAVLALVTAGVLVQVFDLGITGLCIGLIVGRSVLNVAYPVVVGEVIGQPIRAQLRAAFRPMVATALLVGVAALVREAVDVRSWPVLAVGSVATGLGALCVAFGAGLSGDSRALVAARVRSLAGGLRR